MVDRGRIAVGVSLAGVLAAMYLGVLCLNGRQVSDLVLSERGAVQLASSAAFLTGSVLFVVAYRYTHRALYLLFAVAFFFAAGEEAAWGQRAAGLESPAVVAEHNAQGRLTAHNLDIVQDLKRAVGIDLVFAAFLLFVLVYLVLIPAWARRSCRFRALVERHVPVEPLTHGLLLLLNGVLYAAAGAVGTAGVGRDAPTEVAELGCALIMAGVALDAGGLTRSAAAPMLGDVVPDHRRKVVFVRRLSVGAALDRLDVEPAEARHEIGG